MSYGFQANNPDGTIAISDQFTGMFLYGKAELNDTCLQLLGEFNTGIQMSSAPHEYCNDPLKGSFQYVFRTDCTDNPIIFIEPTESQVLYGVLCVTIGDDSTQIIVIQSGRTKHPPILWIYTRCSTAPYIDNSSYGLQVMDTNEDVVFDSRKEAVSILGVERVSLPDTPANDGASEDKIDTNYLVLSDNVVRPNDFNFYSEKLVTSSASSYAGGMFLGYSQASAATYSSTEYYKYLTSTNYSSGSKTWTEYHVEYESSCVDVIDSDGYITGCEWVQTEHIVYEDKTCNWTSSSTSHKTITITSKYGTFYREGHGINSDGKLVRGWIQYTQMFDYEEEAGPTYTTTSTTTEAGCTPGTVSSYIDYQDISFAIGVTETAASMGANIGYSNTESSWTQFPYENGTVNTQTYNTLVAKSPVTQEDPVYISDSDVYTSSSELSSFVQSSIGSAATSITNYSVDDDGVISYTQDGADWTINTDGTTSYSINGLTVTDVANSTDTDITIDTEYDDPFKLVYAPSSIRCLSTGASTTFSVYICDPDSEYSTSEVEDQLEYAVYRDNASITVDSIEETDEYSDDSVWGLYVVYKITFTYTSDPNNHYDSTDVLYISAPISVSKNIQIDKNGYWPSPPEPDSSDYDLPKLDHIEAQYCLAGGTTTYYTVCGSDPDSTGDDELNLTVECLFGEVKVDEVLLNEDNLFMAKVKYTSDVDSEAGSNDVITHTLTDKQDNKAVSSINLGLR